MTRRQSEQQSTGDQSVIWNLSGHLDLPGDRRSPYGRGGRGRARPAAGEPGCRAGGAVRAGIRAWDAQDGGRPGESPRAGDPVMDTRVTGWWDARPGVTR